MKQRYLAIETSSPRLSLAIGDATRTLAHFENRLEWRHSEALFDGIERLLRRQRWKIQSLTGVAVSVGPGSFTGIRVGLAAARALGQALKIPVVGVSSLETMAWGQTPRAQTPGCCRLSKGSDPVVYFMPRIDALRGQIFAVLYERGTNGTLRKVIGEGIATEAEWMEQVKKMGPRLRLRGRHSSLWISPLHACYPEARVLLDLVRGRLAKAGPESYKEVLPFYIRQAAAVERRRR